MQGHLSLILHAHLPFVRHTEHEQFLEESWLFEAIAESYLPLIQRFEQWSQDRLDWRLTLTLSPTLCEMLKDRLLRNRFERHLDGLIELANTEVHRTQLDKRIHGLSKMYLARFQSLQATWTAWGADLVRAFGHYQQRGNLQIITTAATHAVLPMLANHQASLRAQVLTARDSYQKAFGSNPKGFWLPECAYSSHLDDALKEAGIEWFITDTHAFQHGQPSPPEGVYAPVTLENGLIAFGRDIHSARQVWSRGEGYPGDPRYRDFYRDIGFDLDFDYLRRYLPDSNHRGFTGIKYHRITGNHEHKEIYNHHQALEVAKDHARHFVSERIGHLRHASAVGKTPIIVAPYDCELFGHWWFEGPDFLNALVRRVCESRDQIGLITPGEYLESVVPRQKSRIADSTWGQGGYLDVWLNPSNEWIQRELAPAQRTMTELARQHPEAEGLLKRALSQAARELMLAQSSDWPFIIRSGTSPDYARRRVTQHLSLFKQLCDQIQANRIQEDQLNEIEARNSIFADINYAYWA